MEDEKKKRKNKKKKNKQQQNKTPEDTDRNHASNGENGVLPDLRKHQPNGDAETSTVVEAKKYDLQPVKDSLEESNKQLQNDNESPVQKEALLEEKIQNLQNENNFYVQKEATLEETIKHLKSEIHLHIEREACLEEKVMELQNDNDLHIKKQGTLEETIVRLQHENSSCIEKEANLEETIKHFHHENDLNRQKQAALEMSIAELQNEKDLWLQKEGGLEEKISRLLDERAAFDLKGASLEESITQLEKEKAFWVQTENSMKEAISDLNRDIARLRMEVVELEDSRDKLLQENQQLMENISGLQLHVQNLEKSTSSGQSDECRKDASAQEDLNSQIEAACALVDKLIIENSELVEKVNDLYLKLERQSVAAGNSFPIASEEVVRSAVTTNASGRMHNLIENNYPKLDSIGIAPTSDERNDDNNTDVEPFRGPSEADTGEIVQIPLDDIVGDLESQPMEIAATDEVPLTDAPLIGAPFRLISFVAKYVSGADLVNKDSLSAGS